MAINAASAAATAGAAPAARRLKSARRRPILLDVRPRSPARDARLDAALLAERSSVRAWLHDSVLQVLEYLAAGGYADDPDPRELARVAADAAAELRAVVEGSGPLAPAGDADLATRLDVAAAEERRLGAPPIALHVDRAAGALRGRAAQELAAAAREALRNVRKHAGATRAVVTCRLRDDLVELVVSDDGAGFAPARLAPRAVGLRQSIVGRLDRLGGRATVRSQPGRGTRVTLRLPLSAAPHVRAAGGGAGQVA